jgi:hypothetical protein
MRMSPLMIVMLLRYYAHARDYRDEVPPEQARSTAVKEAIECFLSWNLFIPLLDDDVWKSQNPETRLAQYVISDRGRAMVESYKAVKLPVIQWVQP